MFSEAISSMTPRVRSISLAMVVYDDAQGLAKPAAMRLCTAGWTDVAFVDGGPHGWRPSGGELFRDVNAPGMAFGELVEHEAGTLSLRAADGSRAAVGASRPPRSSLGCRRR